METPSFISDTPPENPGLDYTFLRREGIRYIEQLTGAFWTDYNVHDPGVTILEQLCYAITDLCYRTDFPIEDHIFGGKQDINSPLRSPYEVFPANPVLENDYRKIILDSLMELKNVWFYPADAHENTFGGLYKVLVDADERLVKTEEEHQKLVEQINAVFSQNRNLSEDLNAVRISQPVYISLFADIEISRTDLLEKVLSEIYFQIGNYLSPEIHFYSLEEMQAEGYPLEEIFEGPLLRHGFIRSQDLQPKLDKIILSDIIKIMMQIEGVTNVKNLYLEADGQKYDNQFIIPEEFVPRLLTRNEDEKTGLPKINFFNNNLECKTIRYPLVERRLNELQAGNRRVYRPDQNRISIPLGKKIDVRSYYSIQNHFPTIYGIGPEGIPNSPGVQRRGQARQLKGYLLIFEQFMANYLAQLGSVKELFSNRTGSQQTYFYQPLDAVPDAEALYRKSPPKNTKPIEDPILKSQRIPADYRRGLAHLMQGTDEVIDRKNRFLDFILALYGENYNEYIAIQKNYYLPEKEFSHFLLGNKARFLHQLHQLNTYKSRGFNYQAPLLNTLNLSELENKLSVLLGLGYSVGGEGVVKRKLSTATDQFALQIIDEESPEKLADWQAALQLEPTGLSERTLERNFDFIDESDLESYSFTEEQRQSLLQATVPFRLGFVPVSFLRAGTDLTNYFVGGSKKKFYVLFRASPAEPWSFIGEYASYPEAAEATRSLIDFLKRLSLRSEGLHLVEHLLLRPNLDDVQYGLYLLDEKGNPFMRSEKRFRFFDRVAVAEKLEYELGVYENFSVERRTDGNFEMQFRTQQDDPDLRFVSLKNEESVENNHEKKDALFAFFTDRDGIVPYSEKIGFYIQYSEGGMQIPERFFSHRISLIFPDWSVRFSDPEFRAIAETAVHQNKPANLVSKGLWLNLAEMRIFEERYFGWAEAVQQQAAAKKVTQLKNELIEFLFQRYSPDELF